MYTTNHRMSPRMKSRTPRDRMNEQRDRLKAKYLGTQHERCTEANLALTSRRSSRPLQSSSSSHSFESSRAWTDNDRTELDTVSAGVLVLSSCRRAHRAGRTRGRPAAATAAAHARRCVSCRFVARRRRGGCTSPMPLCAPGVSTHDCPRWSVRRGQRC
jgi:hypothetical protein